MIRIDKEEYEHRENLSVSEAFRLALGKPKLEYLASLNGSFLLRSLWDSTLIPDGAELLFIPIASGG